MLSTTEVTDKALVHLKKLTSLTYLERSHTQVTAAGVADLQKACRLPGLYNCREPPVTTAADTLASHGNLASTPGSRGHPSVA